MAACNGKKAEQPQTATTEVAVVTDTAFQNRAAGDYQSYDGSKVITLNSDLTVTTKTLRTTTSGNSLPNLKATRPLSCSTEREWTRISRHRYR